MGLLVLKYTSYTILDHQAAVVFVFILFHNDKDKLSDDNRIFMMSLRQRSTDMSIDVE